MVRIIVTSVADIQKEEAQKLGLKVLPIQIWIDQTSYLDGETIEPAQLLLAMQEGGHVINTRHVPPDELEKAFLEAVEAGEEVLFFSDSERYSSNMLAADVARSSVLEKYPTAEIQLLNSKNASAGYQLMARKLARLSSEGKSMKEILKAAKYYMEHIHHTFVISPDAGFNNAKGKLAHLLGAVGEQLDVKYAFAFNPEGEAEQLIPLSISGNRHVEEWLLESIKEKYGDLKNQEVVFVHGINTKVDETLFEKVEKQLKPRIIHAGVAGCAVSANTGTDFLAGAYLDALDIFE